MRGVPVQDDLGPGVSLESRSMFCSYTWSDFPAGLSTTYCVETPMKLESMIRPVTRLRPSVIASASSRCAREIFSGRMPRSSLPPFAVGAGHRPVGSRSFPPLAATTMSVPVETTSPSMRFEVPRKLATNVVRGFS